MNVVALAGGVGGAKMAHGLAQCLSPDQLTVIVNTGDDFEFLGLKICPDLDTVCYTLAEIANPETGWGRAEETWHALDSLAELDGPTWFKLGDRDLGTHLERTRRIRAGEALDEIVRQFCLAWGIRVTILPMSNDAVPTWVYTEEGELEFQEYFVHRQCRPRVTGFRFAGVETAAPAPGVLKSIREADLIVLCPSNPWVSIDPILSIPGLRPALEARTVVAVSPIIGGQTVKGPAAKMFAELGIDPSAAAIAGHYGSLLSGFVLDGIDRFQVEEIKALGIETFTTDTIMKTAEDRRRLAEEVLAFGMNFQENKKT